MPATAALLDLRRRLEDFGREPEQFFFDKIVAS
jgi:hypothetical protein